MSIKVLNLHPWNLTYKQAVEVQKRLQPRVILTPLKKRVRFVAGADVSYSKKDRYLFGAIVIMDLEKMEPIEEVAEPGKESFNYFPGLLSFREIPILLNLLKKLHHTPEIFILDGQGIAHPRNLGLASHFGLIIDLPTIGCAKTKLIGEYKPFISKRGKYSLLFHQGKKVGAVVCTKDGTRPVFVSPGHKVDILSSIRVVLKSCQGYRLPEPIRKAHSLANSLRSKESD